MELYLVRVSVDQCCDSELPTLLFMHRPTQEEIWNELTKEGWYKVNEEEAPDQSDWDWDYDISCVSIIDNTL